VVDWSTTTVVLHETKLYYYNVCRIKCWKLLWTNGIRRIFFYSETKNNRRYYKLMVNRRCTVLVVQWTAMFLETFGSNARDNFWQTRKVKFSKTGRKERGTRAQFLTGIFPEGPVYWLECKYWQSWKTLIQLPPVHRPEVVVSEFRA